MSDTTVVANTTDNYFLNTLSVAYQSLSWTNPWSGYNLESNCKKGWVFSLCRENKCFKRSSGKYSFGIHSQDPHPNAAPDMWKLMFFSKEHDLSEIMEFRKKISDALQDRKKADELMETFFSELLDEYKENNLEILPKTVKQSKLDEVCLTFVPGMIYRF